MLYRPTLIHSIYAAVWHTFGQFSHIVLLRGRYLLLGRQPALYPAEKATRTHRYFSKFSQKTCRELVVLISWDLRLILVFEDKNLYHVSYTEKPLGLRHISPRHVRGYALMLVFWLRKGTSLLDWILSRFVWAQVKGSRPYPSSTESLPRWKIFEFRVSSEKLSQFGTDWPFDR